MNPRVVGTLILIITAACFITGIIVYPHLPLQALAHWNASGQANGTFGRAWAAFLLPALMLLVWGAWAIIPGIDPIAPGYPKFRYIYDFALFMVVAFLAYVYALTLGANLGWQFNMTQALLPGLAVLIVVIGSLMPYIKRNWFFGIRTPWTLSSEAVWDKTHEFGGHLFQAAGITIGIASFTSPATSVGLIVGSIFAATIASVVYSYILFTREKAHQP